MRFRRLGVGSLAGALAVLIQGVALVPAQADPAASFAWTQKDLRISAYLGTVADTEAAFAEAERWIGPNTVLATNTSSLSITVLAEGLRHPERVVGFHVFNPVSVVPLVEIIPAGGPGVAVGPVATGNNTDARVTNESTLAVVSGLATKLRDARCTRPTARGSS